MEAKEYSERVMAVVDSIAPLLRQWLRDNETYTVQLTINPSSGEDCLLVQNCGLAFGWISQGGDCVYDFNGSLITRAL
jgi:hypothetical protein